MARFIITGNDPTSITFADGCGKQHDVKDGVADLDDECAAAAVASGFDKVASGDQTEPAKVDRLAAARAAKAAKKAASE